MPPRNRIIAGIIIIIAITGLVVGVDLMRRLPSSTSTGTEQAPPGSIPIYVQGKLVASFVPDDLQRLQKTGFVESAQGVTQEGWLLKDVLLLYLPENQLKAQTTVTVISSSRQKQAVLTWEEISQESNMVLFDLSNRGTLKLVSLLDRLDTRDEWVQDVDKIEVGQP